MNLSRKSLVKSLMTFASVCTVAGAPCYFATEARADDCNTTLASVFAGAPGHNTDFRLVTNRNDDKHWSSYTFGSMSLGGSYLQGTGQQIFSDRFVSCGTGCFSTQPYSVTAADSITVYVSQSGAMWIYNNTWGGWTVLTGQCYGPMVYAYDGSAQMYVLSFGTQHAIVR